MDAQPAILSLGMLATFALALGGARLLRQRRDRTRGALMLVAALVLFANVLLWAWPMPAKAAAVSSPAAVRAYLARRASCDHWRGEEPYDARRRSQILGAERRACSGLEEERRRLRLRHRGDASVLRWLRRHSEG